ncbi:hypothetical protein EB837_02920 [Kluyvera ascorbata]|uniref:Uncharacterized protein n=1 Tax=Kluyvera ascorbata TaxID=51288 RepID=A0A3N2SDN2_9ENTR|nr:hypothetical protein [Kluyvera ascorbata]ROU17788.1 hypothetical protein EB837_02920 [Kluyvera ascorbata]
MKFKPWVAESFRTGASNTPFAVDGTHLTDDELQVIQNFMEDVANGRTLVGKNKPSWVDDNHNKIPGSDNYEQENYWHYHCGPTWRPNTFKNRTVDLKFNPGGKHSTECIHYAKDGNEIVIVGYSRVHIPFLPSDYNDNPLFGSDEED